MPNQCGNCGETGHNKRTCRRVSTKNPKKSDTTTVIEAETCPICMETLEKTNYASTKCGHQFCLDCLIRHVGNKANCPICRADVGNPVPVPVPDYTMSDDRLELSILTSLNGVLRDLVLHAHDHPDERLAYEIYNQYLAVNILLERHAVVPEGVVD